MQVVEPGFGAAMCRYGDELRRIDTMLVGEVPAGAWVLVFIDAAREVISPADAGRITDALSALQSVMNGGDGDVDHLFADIIANSAANQKDAS